MTRRVKFTKLLTILATFFTVHIIWIFFNVKTLETGIDYLKQMFSFTDMNILGVTNLASKILSVEVLLVIAIVLLGNIFADRITKLCVKILNFNLILRIVIVIAAFFTIYKLGPTIVPPFIYFSF